MPSHQERVRRNYEPWRPTGAYRPTAEEVPCSVCGTTFWAELWSDTDRPPSYFCAEHSHLAPWKRQLNG